MPTVLASLAVLQVALMYLPPLTWPLWLAHFVALETCLLAVITGGAALALGEGGFVRVAGALGVVGGLLPAVAVAPQYAREGLAFSPLAWLGVPGARVAVDRDVPLAGGLLADIYRPPGAGPHPWVVVVHGGSWRSGDKGDAEHVSHAIASAGFQVFDVQYRLAPAHPFPAGVGDVRCLVATVQEQAAALGVDPARGALLGRSAGGQLALVAAWSDLPPSCGARPLPLKAAISIYGPADLAWAHGHPFTPDVVRGPEALEQYLGGTPARAPENYRLATPMTWLDHPVPPTLLIHGTAERCVRPVNAERLAASLVSGGNTVRTLYIPFADHGFDVRRGGLGEQLARGVILDFLRRNV
jgi:acetyl esterase/lipase